MKPLHVRTFLLLLAATAFVGTSGFLVSKLTVEPTAFGEGKRYAMVTVIGTNKISADSQSGGLMGGLKALSSKHSFSADSAPVLNAAPDIIEAELRKSRSFVLVPASQVMRNATFQKLEGDKTRGFMGMRIVPANGYKFFKSDDKIKQLARALNVDGVIVMSASYTVGFSGVTAGAGVVSAGLGKQYGMGTISVRAMDRDGKVVWSHAKEEKAKKGFTSTGGAADFEKLRPHFSEATRLATAELVAALDKKLAAK